VTDTPNIESTGHPLPPGGGRVDQSYARSVPRAGPRLTGDPSADLAAVLSHRPAYAAALQQVLHAIWDQEVVDVMILELCRLRIGHLLGATPVPTRVDEEVCAALPRWPSDDRFDPRTRAALGYAEQLLLDAQAVTDDDARTVIESLGEDGFLVLTYACGVFETIQRAELVLGGPRSTA
jgi:hypothetical protein